MKGIAKHVTHSRAFASDHSAAYERATVKMKHLFSTGHILETFLLDDGSTQVSWRPGIPPLKHKFQRENILPHYKAALDFWHEFLGRKTVIRDGLTT